MGSLHRWAPQYAALVVDEEATISGVICRTWVFWGAEGKGAL